MYVKSFKELIVWQKSMILVKKIYNLTNAFPKSEVRNLISQMCRAAVSIPSNIAEGKQRKTKKDFIQFLRIANGSAAELETQILAAKDIYTDVHLSKAESLLEEIQKMLSVMIKKLETSKS